MTYVIQTQGPAFGNEAAMYRYFQYEGEDLVFFLNTTLVMGGLFNNLGFLQLAGQLFLTQLEA